MSDKQKSDENAAAPQPCEIPTMAIGLHSDQVHRRLQQGKRLGDVGQRVLAFYLVELDERQLHKDTGHSSTLHYAASLLDMDRRRAGELLRAGRALERMPLCDAAFCNAEFGWSKLLLLTTVVPPTDNGPAMHEAAWIEKAKALSCRDLALEVRLAKPGGPPRGPGDRKGLPDVRYDWRARLDATARAVIEEAHAKLNAERGRELSGAELLVAMAELVLSTREDGSLPGRTPIDDSLYRIVVRADDAAAEGTLLVDTPMGPTAIDGPAAEAICCDADIEVIDENEEAGCCGKSATNHVKAPKTPSAMRRRVIRRDGGRCRCCGSRRSLMVHHIAYRSEGGRTAIWNLITLCRDCHTHVHAGLLVIEGKRASEAAFRRGDGSALHDPDSLIPEDGVRMYAAPARVERTLSRAGRPARSMVTLEDVPQRVDGDWWRAHASLLQCRSDGSLHFHAGVGDSTGAGRPARPDAAIPSAFDGIVGQDALVARLQTAVSGSRARDVAFPHVLFAGPPGTGKTTLTRALASFAGVRLVDTAGPLLTSAHELIRLLAELDEGDMLFIDEIHAVPRPVLETLYQAMAERRLSLTLSSGARTRALTLDLPAFTLLAATSESGDLPEALISRFGVHERLGFYSTQELVEIIRRAGRPARIEVGPAAAQQIANCCRGTPREALRLRERVLDAAACRGVERVDGATAAEALRALGYDERGMLDLDRRYLQLLRESGGPIPLGRLARMLGVSARLLTREVEPLLFLRGEVRITPRGRVAA